MSDTKAYFIFVLFFFVIIAVIANIESKNQELIECYKAAQVNKNIKCEDKP